MYLGSFSQCFAEFFKQGQYLSERELVVAIGSSQPGRDLTKKRGWTALCPDEDDRAFDVLRSQPLGKDGNRFCIELTSVVVEQNQGDGDLNIAGTRRKFPLN